MSNDLKLKVNLGNIGSKLKHFGKAAADTALFTISNRLKKAFTQELELRKGLKLVINQYDLKGDVSVDFEVQEPPLEFAYCISGMASSKIKTCEGNDIEIDFAKTNCIIFYFPDSKGKIEIFSNEPLNMLSLHIAPDFLNDFIDGHFDDFPEEFLKLVKHSSRETFLSSGEMTSDMFDIVSEILNCEFEGLTRRMFLESKALELMTRHIVLISKQHISENKINIRKDELEIIEKIKAELENNLADPPSLFEIAKSAGFNHSKLNAGFKQLYDTTVFGFIRSKRLEQAKYKLKHTELSISEIAYELGFSSPSHFTREFSRAFNITPKQYRKK